MKKRGREREEDSLLEELKSYLAIDKHSLDTEIERQPSLFFKVGEAYVKAAAHRDYCKEEIGRIDADLYGKYRKKFEKTGQRVTEGQLANAITSDPDHQAAVDAHIKARTEADMLSGLKEAFNQRSYMLRDLVALHLSSYYEKTAITDTGNNRELKARKNIDLMDKARRERRASRDN